MRALIIIAVYLTIINLTGFLSMFIDKRKAIKRAYRIPEANLFLIAIMGGSIGSCAGMFIFHHKTRHWYFLYGLPFIIVIQILLVLLLVISPVNITFI